MPVLINDWDSRKGRPTVVWGVKCARCGRAEKNETPATPKGWEEAKTPNADGRMLAQCPDCMKD